MARQIVINDSLTVNPSNYTGLTNLTVSSTQYPVSNGYTDTSSTSYARFTTTYNSAGYCYYTFSIDDIPNGATITSVTASVKVRINNTGRVSNTNCQLYTGTTAKGSGVTFASTSTSNIISLNNTGSWTVSELDDLRLRIGGQGSNSNNSGYIYFYGANITINYSLNTMAYTIAASSSLSNLIPSPTTQEVYAGESAEIRIDGDTLEDAIVTDNDIDVTSSLEKRAGGYSDSIAQTASSFTTGFSGGSSMNFYTSSSSTGNNFNYAVGHMAESPGSTSSGSGSWTYVKEGGSSTNNTGYADFVFDFSSIPVNATITSVEVKCYGAVESTSQSTSHADITLFSGNTQKGTMQKFTSTSNSIITISSPGTWTREELQSAKLRFAVGYYGGHIFGITWTVNYSVQENDYWVYSLSNVTTDHVILIDQEGAYIPPEEDPQYTYHSLTISSINATTSPPNGTTRVIEGTNNVITIVPSDPQLTLALDNGVDITSQLQGGIPDNTYTVTNQVSGANYGFNLNSGTGYYTSTNAGQASSASVCRVNFDFETACLVTISYINYAEGTYDYGIFGNIDTALGTTSTADSNAYHSCSASSENTANVQVLTYNIPAGTHYIDIKYRKDTYTDENNDSLQWKITSIESTEGSGSYTYTLNNIQTNHSLIFVFGNVTYWFVNSSGINCRLFPDGQQVKLDGQSYIIKIVPNNISDSVILTDNNVEQTIIREDGFDKEGNPAVSYSYKISSVRATHNIIVTSSSSSTEAFYIKSGGIWLPVTRLYIKENGVWTEQLFSYIEDEEIQHIKQG